MFIVCADRSNIVNVDNVISVGIDGKMVTAVTGVDDMILGKYQSEKRAGEVFASLLENVFPPMLVFQNFTIDQEEFEKINTKNAAIYVSGNNTSVEQIDRGVFYMPEE